MSTNSFCHLRPEFAAGRFGNGSARFVKTLVVEPGSPWENGYIGSYNARLRNELLDGEIFYSLDEVRVITGCSTVQITLTTDDRRSSSIFSITGLSQILLRQAGHY